MTLSDRHDVSSELVDANLPSDTQPGNETTSVDHLNTEVAGSESSDEEEDISLANNSPVLSSVS